MRRIFLRSISRLLILLPLILGSCASMKKIQFKSVHDGYSATQNLIYTPEDWPEKIPGDLYQPKKSKHLSPGVLLIHGGGWTGSDGRWEMAPIAKQLAKHGYVVFNVTYRLAPEYIYPAPVEDMREAVRWMRSHAAEIGIDPNNIATFGYSAGGYLAAMTGYDIEANHIRAVVAGGTPAKLSLYPGGDLIPQFLGGTKQEIPHRFVEASPVSYVSSQCPPTFVYHATSDKLVPLEQPKALIHELESKNVPHETYWIEGRNHVGAFLFPAGAIDKAIRFLDRNMR